MITKVMFVRNEAMKNTVLSNTMATRKNAKVEWNSRISVQLAATTVLSVPYAP